ncbi:hypothetical protein [Lysobacter gummosus]|uniref:hypothetical protein n=1 Tax=Lysobacter gummosus TaxID=262324 RepID=UPI00362AF0C4
MRLRSCCDRAISVEDAAAAECGTRRRRPRTSALAGVYAPHRYNCHPARLW